MRSGEEFDFPWIAKKISHQRDATASSVPNVWEKQEIPHIDTMELWKFGDWKSFISLELMAHLFGVLRQKMI